MAKIFSDLLNASRVCLPLRSLERESVVEELTRFLAEAHGREDLAQALREGVWKRESDLSTGIGRGVAFPHAEIGIPIEPMAVIGIAPDGIDFDAPDSKPVHLFFLLVCSEESRAERLELLSKLSNVLRDPTVPKRLRAALSPEEVVEIIRSKEGTD